MLCMQSTTKRVSCFLAVKRLLPAVLSNTRPQASPAAGVGTMSRCAASSTSKAKVIVITGPTAVGKTKLSLALAKQLDGEIISADSVQVYQGLNIGSDKVSISQRQGIPHHLIDILQPSEEFSAGDFHTAARQATEEILSR